MNQYQLTQASNLIFMYLSSPHLSPLSDLLVDNILSQLPQGEYFIWVEMLSWAQGRSEYDFSLNDSTCLLLRYDRCWLDT